MEPSILDLAVSALIEDGQSPAGAAYIVGQTVTRAQSLLVNVRSKEQFTKKDVMNIDLLPALLCTAPFDLQPAEWVALCSERNRTIDNLEAALRYYSLWSSSLSSSQIRGIVEKYFFLPSDSLPDFRSVTAASRYADRLMGEQGLVGEDKEIMLQHFAKHGDVFQALGHVPYHLWPEEHMYRPIMRILESSAPVTTDTVKTKRYTNHAPKTCPHLEQRHFESLLGLHYHDWVIAPPGELALLYVGGELVAAMKRRGSRSVIGLRNVRDSDGRYPLISGGVYATSLEVRNAAERAGNSQPLWAVLELDELPVRPLRLHKYFTRGGAPTGFLLELNNLVQDIIAQPIGKYDPATRIATQSPQLSRVVSSR